ncbi:MAG: hypothetical protein KAH21_02685, partial [Spirochaetaceae bacterium]|nr:hypothetical protein [Spirochaetaceae bacterium]
AVTPRLYEARLWELFEDVTSGIEIQPADRRILTSFLLNYMSSRRNLSSVDVAIDRYLKVFPDEKWIYSWRLASDASRGMAIINLVSPQIDQMSPYENFRNLALSEKSWRAVHDSALFAIIASDEINELLKGFSINSDDEIQQEDEIGTLDRAILNILKSYKTLPQIEKTPFADRIETLENNREDLFESSFKSKFSLSGKKKMEMEQSRAFAVLRSTSLSLLQNALHDLEDIDLEELNLSDENHADLLYLEAFLLKKENRLQESAVKANEVLGIISDHPGARDLLEQEVTL